MRTDGNDFAPMERGSDEYEIHHTRTLVHSQYRFHTHDFFEIYLLISGEVSIYLEEYVLTPIPGTVIVFPPGYMHRAVKEETDTPYERMYIYVSRDCLRQMGIQVFSPLQVLEQCAQHHRFLHQVDPGLFQQCQMIFGEVLATSTGILENHQKLIDRCKVTIALASLCKAFRDTQDAGILPPNHRVARLIAYINEHLAEDLSLNYLETVFYVSKYHMLREFKTYTNRTLHQYVISKRVILAKKLMQSGHSPTDVFSRCGFQEYSGFYRAFKNETHMTPHAYCAGAQQHSLPFRSRNQS